MNFHLKFYELFTTRELDYLLSQCSIYQMSNDKVDYMYFSTDYGFRAEIRMDLEGDEQAYIYDLTNDVENVIFLNKKTFLKALRSNMNKEKEI